MNCSQASKVIVPIGLNHDAERIMPIVARVAEVLGASTELIHVVPSLEADERTARRRAWMAPMADRSGSTLRMVEHESVSIALRDVLADQPDAVVCMHVDADGGAADTVLGSLSEDILRAGHHRCVLIGPKISPEPSITDGPVIVCVDGSEHSESILPDAVAWAEATGNSTWVVLVASGEGAPADVDESAYVHRVAQHLGLDDPQWEVLHGRHPAKAIIDFAEQRGAGSIVMATHGRSGFARLALGSTTLRVVHGASCPVITRRPPFLSAIVN